MSVEIVNHPLVRHKLGLLRCSDTNTGEFRRIANELASLLTYEATKDFPTENAIVKGWADNVQVEVIAGKKLTVVPILRAGLGLMDGVLNMVPAARIGVVGLYRNEKTLEPVEYYVKLPHNMPERRAIILDPMLATGGSMLATIRILKKYGCNHISSINLVCAPEGLAKIEAEFPDVKIFTASVDERLNDEGYILPGLGDAGDRIFGTK